MEAGLGKRIQHHAQQLASSGAEDFQVQEQVFPFRAPTADENSAFERWLLRQVAAEFGFLRLSMRVAVVGAFEAAMLAAATVTRIVLAAHLHRVGIERIQQA